MPREEKRFAGILNLDDRPEFILSNQHIDALNGRFYGGAQGLVFQNLPGNTLIANTLPAGNNQCIGSFFDSLKQRIFWFNWNSNGRNGIYKYEISTNTASALLVSFTNSAADIFNFDLDYPIASVDIIYTTEDDGDILTWVARNERPKALNILEAENNLYGSAWLESYLDLAKEPPSIPIKCAYEDDATVTVNNLRKKLFKFKYRFWYTDNEKSTWSSESEIPVPFYYSDPQVDTDPTKNCRIGCVIQTGDASVVKVEIATCESLGNVFSNYFSTIILDKSELSIPNNDTYIWRFYNNEAYVFVELQESILLYDRVPDLANSQSLLNGNTIIYGGITEGKDPVVPDVDMTTFFEYPLSIDYTNILSATQYGKEGFVQGENIRIIVIGTIRRGQTYNIAVLVGATTFTITYTAVVDDTPALVLAGLSTSATGQGFTQVSITANELVISRTNQILIRSNIATTDQSISAIYTINTFNDTVTITGGSSFLSLFSKGVMFIIYTSSTNTWPFTVVSSVVAGADLVVTVQDTQANELIAGILYFVNPVNNSIPAYNSSSKENWCLFYFDEKGKTNQATTADDFNVTTLYLGINRSANTYVFLSPYITAQINHRPPIWAKSYQWGRTMNLTKQSYLFWITSGTYKDDKYAYISIESINAYKVVNPSSVISYDFVPGDRIKFYILYNTSGKAIIHYSNDHDYEIYDQVVNPDINGTVRKGQFLKIILPNTSGSFDFSSGLTLDYNNYYIELYTPAKSASEGLNVYYEFGEEYGIGNAGTANAYHQGMLQNQSADLVTPATFKFNKGDAWYRTRNIPIGNTILYDLVGGNSFGTSTILGQQLTTQAYSTPDYIVASSIAQQPFINNPNSPGWTLAVNLNSYTFKLRGVINVVANNATNAAPRITAYVLFGTNSTQTYIIGGYTGSLPITAGQTIIFNVDTSITMPANSKIFIVMNTIDGNFRCTLISGYLGFSEPQKDFIVGVIDQNFSDFYESKVNSNGRPMKVNPDEKTTFFPTLLRWGSPYQQNTNINQINRFFDDSKDEVDRAKGDIQRLKARDRILRVFQNRAVGQYGVFARFIQNNSGNQELVTTNDIITKGNINYYEGRLGLGDQYTGLVSATNQDYGVDPVTGDDWRLSNDGFTKIGELYKGQFTIRNLLVPYNKTYLRPDGSKAKIIGCFNYFDGEWIKILQGGTNGSSTISNYAFSFNEKRNGYSSFFSFNQAEWIQSAQDVIFMWKDGALWKMDIGNPSGNYCNYFGTQYSCYVTLVFNVNFLDIKTPESIAEVASEVWACPLIYTSVNSYSGQRQESLLINQDFSELEGEFKAAFLRDIHSIGGLVNGDTLKASYLVTKFEISSPTNQVRLSEVSLMYKDSPLNVK